MLQNSCDINLQLECQNALECISGHLEFQKFWGLARTATSNLCLRHQLVLTVQNAKVTPLIPLCTTQAPLTDIVQCIIDTTLKCLAL